MKERKNTRKKKEKRRNKEKMLSNINTEKAITY
jgi:hypothetical protein